MPEEFKIFLGYSNGFSLPSAEVYGLSDSLSGSSLDQVYLKEHGNGDIMMPKNLMPFSPDGRGNHYCLDLSRLADEPCPVVFWQWDYYYPDVTQIETRNPNFISWVDEVMIQWTLEMYDYEGNEI